MRNPLAPHRDRTEANERRTQERIAEYHGVDALLRTWEQASTQMQARNHDYILKLRARQRMVKNLILHRAGPDADL